MEPIYIVTEFMCHGTLLDFLRKGEGQYLPLSGLIDAAVQIACGMRYLEKEGYVHLDLRAEMILVADNFVYKLSGFNFVRERTGDTYIMSYGDVYPVRWTAPESIRSHNFTIKSDVWSFGVLLTELVTKGRVPYSGMTNADVGTKVERGYRMESPAGCPRQVYEIIVQCWSADPADRPTFEFLQMVLEDYCTAKELG